MLGLPPPQNQRLERERSADRRTGITVLRRRTFLALAAAFSARPQDRDPWPATAVIEPADFATQLHSHPSTLTVLYAGFPVLFRSAHIPGALLAGPCSKPEGLAVLRKHAATLSPAQTIVLYCGCCPFDHCPNIRPAFTALRNMNFQHLRVLHLATNLHTDWIAKGYPIQKI